MNASLRKVDTVVFIIRDNVGKSIEVRLVKHQQPELAIGRLDKWGI